MEFSDHPPAHGILFGRTRAMSKQRPAGIPWEVAFIALILIIAGMAHGMNMFHYPYQEDDEGTYMSQAWAMVFLRSLSPYSYGYDHAPGGWLLIAGWSVLTGGFHTFGPAINSGRIFMLILQIANTCMVYLISRTISQSKSTALVASLLFSLSPYGIYFHRRVLLDNICTFWMLLSLLVLFSKHLPLKTVGAILTYHEHESRATITHVCMWLLSRRVKKAWLSAVLLGFSVLSKEVTIFMVPAFMCLVYTRFDKTHRLSAMIGWLVLFVSVISTYILLAVIRHEFFPFGTWLGGTSNHPSLLGTLVYQASRGRDGGLLDIHSSFWHFLVLWVQADPIVVLLGTTCTFIAVFLRRKNRDVGIMGLLSLSLWLFLCRGGITYIFYLVPLLPLLAINTALVSGMLVKFVEKRVRLPKRTFQTIFFNLALCGIIWNYFGPSLVPQNINLELWTNYQADAQNEATAWVVEHISPGSKILIDNYMWTDLHGTERSLSFLFARYYWQVAFNSGDKVFHEDWHQADYVITTKQMILDARNNNMKLVLDAIAHSRVIAHFDTGGWPVDIRKIIK